MFRSVGFSAQVFMNTYRQCYDLISISVGFVDTDLVSVRLLNCNYLLLSAN